MDGQIPRILKLVEPTADIRFFMGLTIGELGDRNTWFITLPAMI